MKKLTGLTALILLSSYLFFWPTQVDPVAWQAPKAPALEGEFQVNNKLSTVKRLAMAEGIGPETIAIDTQGFIYTGYQDGKVVRFNPQGKQPDLIVNTQGRPLGIDIAEDGSLIIADALKGLLRVTPENGAIELLTDSANNQPFKFTDDVVIAKSGMIYFTDASSKFGPAMHARDDILEHGGHGRLIQYNPHTKETHVLLEGLQFANGVALSKDQSYLLVAETGNYSVVRYWLTGPNTGQHDLFLENLPGIPDGISSNGEGIFWLALFSPRNALLDFASPYPWLRKLFFRIPAFLQPQPAAHAFVLGINEQAHITHNLQDASEHAFHPITSVIQHNRKLYLGSLTADHFAVYDLD